MANKLLIYSIVYDEIIEAIEYYESIYPQLGKRFERAIQSALDNVEATPLAYFNLDDGKHRRIPIHGFPYAFIYCFTGNEIIVKMLFPLMQDPARLWARVNI
jgi:hypothetical protein